MRTNFAIKILINKPYIYKCLVSNKNVISCDMAVINNEHFRSLLWYILLVYTCEQLRLVNGQPITTMSETGKASMKRVFISDSGKLLNGTDKQTRNCHSLCGYCDCMGFYCVEECICECNSQAEIYEEQHFNVTETIIDTECLAVMQKNARNLKLPFELLIQGPNANRIVRTALHLQDKLNSNKTYTNAIKARNKRSTIVIYSPAVFELKRDKRGVNRNNMEWFNELTNSFIPGVLRKTTQKTQWPMFSELNQNTVKIANLKKIQSSIKSKTTTPYKLSATLNRNSKHIKNIQKHDYVIFNDSMGHDNYKIKEPKQNNHLNLNRATSTTVVENGGNSIESFANIFYETPMKILDQIPAVMRDAIRRMRNHEPMSEIGEISTEEQKDSLEDQQHSTYNLGSLHEQLLMKTIEHPKMKSKKVKLSKYELLKITNILQRLKKIINDQ